MHKWLRWNDVAGCICINQLIPTCVTLHLLFSTHHVKYESILVLYLFLYINANKQKIYCWLWCSDVSIVFFANPLVFLWKWKHLLVYGICIHVLANVCHHRPHYKPKTRINNSMVGNWMAIFCMAIFLMAILCLLIFFVACVIKCFWKRCYK